MLATNSRPKNPHSACEPCHIVHVAMVDDSIESRFIITAIINIIKIIIIIKREIFIRSTTLPAGWRVPKQSLLQGYNLGESALTVTHLYSVLADYNFCVPHTKNPLKIEFWAKTSPATPQYYPKY